MKTAKGELRVELSEQGQEAHSLVVAVEFGKNLRDYLVLHNTGI